MFSKIKRISIIFVLILIVYLGFVSSLLRKKDPAKLDPVAVNDITQTLAKNWDRIRYESLTDMDYGYDYVVVDNEGNLLVATKRGLNEDISSAISNRDTIVDILKDNDTLGKIFIFNDIEVEWNKSRIEILTIAFIAILGFSVFIILFLMYSYRRIFRPFEKLRGFAKDVAAGNLDAPLAMDKDNVFGAFSESFDLMREELKKARDNERVANQSKKELVASLSHDIKTPVASIMAVSEIMQAKSTDSNDIEQLKIIYSKSEQINGLITNMFTATLEELQELKVEVTEQSSNIINDLINRADYNNRVVINCHGECLVLMDELRLSQVVDNIISNSYKYADTSIDVSIDVNNEFLEIIFLDYGIGVAETELPLLFNKFYRAGNADGKSGSGLGLYISRYLMKEMSGDIECQNIENGFMIKLKLMIA